MRVCPQRVVSAALIGIMGGAGCEGDDAPGAEAKLDVMLTVMLDRGPGDRAHAMPSELMRVRAGTFENASAAVSTYEIHVGADAGAGGDV